MISRPKHLSTILNFLVYKWRNHRQYFKSLLNKRCLLCDEVAPPKIALCTPCQQDLPWNDTYCQHCALPLPSHQANLICGECISSPPPFDKCVSTFIYEFPVNELIPLGKYRNKRYFLSVLSQLLGHSLAETSSHSELPEVLIPIPMHHKKLKSRGYNQSELIAKHLGAYLDIPVDNNWLRKSQNTSNQADLNRAERKRNLKNTFSIKGKQNYKYVAIIDDVITTRATMEVVSNMLKQEGVQNVEAWSLARTPKLQ